MEEENPVHIRLRYSESLEGKRNLLSLEMSLLNMTKILRRYNALREEEIEIKSGIYEKIKQTNLSIKKAKTSFPLLKIPEKMRKEKQEQKAIKEKPKLFTGDSDEDIESQLRNIQEKLRSISNG